MCSEHWKQAADLVLEPDVSAFEYDAFAHTPALIQAGEAAARAAVPTLRKWLDTPRAVGRARAAGALVQAATMPAD